MAAIKRVIVSEIPTGLSEGVEVFVENGSGGLDLYIGDASNAPVLVSENQFALKNGNQNQKFNVDVATEPNNAVPKDQMDSELADKVSTSEAVISEDIRSIVELTQAEYDALDPIDPDTLYLIVEV